MDRLADLTQDNALQQSQIQQLRSVMAARLAALDETVAQVRAGDEAGLVGRIKVGHGKALMDEARSILGAMTAEQTELLTQRHAANEAAAAREVRFNDAVFGSGFAILFAAAIGTILANRIAERMRLATEIAATDARLRLFVERAPAAIAMFDKDMHYLMASRRYLEDYALDVSAGAEALVGRSHYDVFPEIPERWHYIHRRVLAGETLSADDDPFPRASGGTDWVRWEMTPWKQPNGEIGGALLMSEVVTARKQAERRRDCLLQLADRLRDAPRDAAATAVAMLGEFDCTCIAGWAEVDDAEAHITVTHESAGATFSPPIASPGTVTFGAEIIEELRAGCTLVVDASTSKPHPVFIPADLRSLVAIPLLRNGRPRAMLYLCHGEQHAWTKSQTRLAEEVAARSWALIEQTRLQDTLEQTAEEFRPWPTASHRCVGWPSRTAASIGTASAVTNTPV